MPCLCAGLERELADSSLQDSLMRGAAPVPPAHLSQVLQLLSRPLLALSQTSRSRHGDPSGATNAPANARQVDRISSYGSRPGEGCRTKLSSAVT